MIVDALWHSWTHKDINHLWTIIDIIKWTTSNQKYDQASVSHLGTMKISNKLRSGALSIPQAKPIIHWLQPPKILRVGWVTCDFMFNFNVLFYIKVDSLMVMALNSEIKGCWFEFLGGCVLTCRHITRQIH